MNKKKTAIICMALSVFALGTVGFSAWVISGITNPSIENSVTVDVSDVNDNRITTEMVADRCDTKLVFGPAENDTDKPFTTGGKDVEDLKLTLVYTLTAKDDKKTIEKLAPDVSATLSMTSDTEFETCITNKYITSPLEVRTPFLLVDEGSATNGTAAAVAPDASNVTTYTSVFTFGWGSYFGGHNPSLWTDAISGGAQSEDDVIGALTTLKTINTSGWKITIITSID